ncbi:hypothetical protein CR513_53756, partial [Mucuna pruriens]
MAMASKIFPFQLSILEVVILEEYDERYAMLERKMFSWKATQNTILTNKVWRAKDLLELVHTNICGPMRTPSLNNNRYFILFINDFSRMTCIYFLKEKLKVFGIFKKFKALVEKQSGKHIKVLKSDRKKKKSTTPTSMTKFVRIKTLSGNLLSHILRNKMVSLRGRIA